MMLTDIAAAVHQLIDICPNDITVEGQKQHPVDVAALNLRRHALWIVWKRAPPGLGDDEWPAARDLRREARVIIEGPVIEFSAWWRADIAPPVRAWIKGI